MSRKDVIPHGVRVLTFATAIRWIGWGFAEPLIPVLIFTLAGTYAGSGLVRAAYDIGFILALPVVGMAADRFRATTLILIGLALYVTVGASYFAAGATGLIIFLVVARLMNGLTFALDGLGRETYTRRHTPREHLATVFGYVDTVANFWWIAAAAVGILLVRWFSVHTLLFLIAPTSLISFAIVWRFRRRGGDDAKGAVPAANGRFDAYREAFRELGTWAWPLRMLAVLNFFIAFSTAVVGFFLPIDSYAEGNGLAGAAMVSILLTLPALFGWTLGKWFDRRGIALFPLGFLAFSILLLLPAVTDGLVAKLIVALGAGIVAELLSVGSNELVTVHANPEHFGRVGGVMKSITDIGSMAGPLATGILIDWQGTGPAFAALSALMVVLAAMFIATRRRWTARPAQNDRRYHHRVHQR